MSVLNPSNINEVEITLEEAQCMVSGRKMVDGTSPFNKIKVQLPDGANFISMRLLNSNTIEVTHNKGATMLKLHQDTTKRVIAVLRGFGTV